MSVTCSCTDHLVDVTHAYDTADHIERYECAECHTWFKFNRDTTTLTEVEK